MAATDICRICLCNAMQMHSVSVFYKISAEKTVSEVITHIAPVEVSEEDPLPKFICINCYQVILLIENFLQQIVTSDYQLKQKVLQCQDSIKKEKFTEDIDPIKIKVEKEQEVPIKIEVEIDIKEEPYFHEIDNEIPNESLNSDYMSSINTSDESKNTDLTNSNEHGRKLFSCQLCGKELLELGRFKDHMISHTDKPFMCKYCCTRFKNNTSLKEHFREIHGKCFEDTEKEVTSIAGELKNSHIEPTSVIENIKQDFHIEGPSQIQVANQRLFQDGTLSVDNIKCTENENLKKSMLDCNLCPKKLRCKNHKINIKKLAKQVEPPKIEFEGTQYPPDIGIHKDRLVYKCEVCFKSFNSEESLEEHRKNHNRERKLECKFCKIIFKTPEELKLHKAIHLETNPKKYTCPQCKKLFEEKMPLFRHMENDHPGKNLFVCKICRKRFQFSKALRIHNRIKHNEKICKTSSSKTRMQVHTEFTCDFCKQIFKQRHHLQIHITKKHKEEEKQS